MYKLKNDYIDRMIDKKVTSKEIDFILYISRFQNDAGVVFSVYYKDVCDSIHISHQKFYDILESLTRKGLIQCQKPNGADFCVTLINNDFTDKDFSKGYLNVALQDFQKPEFMNLKGGAKLLYLYMQRFTKGRHMLLNRFYDEFCERFHCVKKTIQEYLRQLKKAYYVISKRKRNKSYNYEMCLKNGNSLHYKASERMRLKSENGFYESNIMQLLQNKFKRFMPDRAEQVLEDISQLAITRFMPDVPNVPFVILSAVQDSIRLQSDEGKDKPLLNAALVNKCLSERINHNPAYSYI